MTRLAYFPAIMVSLVVAALAVTTLSTENACAQNHSELKNLMQDVPEQFTHFHFSGHNTAADLLTHYLWYHLYNRAGHNMGVFNKEYLLTADMWLHEGDKPAFEKSIQQIHRRQLLDIRFDREGYVQSHQHFSHAHDHGWPFPLWTQADSSPDRVRGKTAGWHFQELEHIPGWVRQYYLSHWKSDEYYGQGAVSQWELQNAKSLGIKNHRWHIQAAGLSPAMLTPKESHIDAFSAPYLQLRWKRSAQPKNHNAPYIEWQRRSDGDFGPDRRIYFYLDKTILSGATGCYHSIIPMYRHPEWTGDIKRIRIVLAPGESDVQFEIDSFFTVYDTRHSINNPIFILAGRRYFNWTGDLAFLRENINRMRLALRYQQTVMGGLKYNHIRNPWPGHDGLAGWRKLGDRKVVKSGHGIGNNYWDLLPFGWDDMYATAQYYAATLAMAELEQAIGNHPEWNMPLGASQMQPAELRAHARAVRAEANRLFWNEKTGRFVACIDKKGEAHDYGFSFLNLDAIWYGIASDEHARAIMDWLSGRRIVPGDTSTGEDIYHWRFGPRATTRRNVQWYGQGWTGPEAIPWGGQIQDGGAVLGFSFYDLWARLKVLGPDNAWQRLLKILDWQQEVWTEGGYRKYYESGKHGTTLQGGGTAGGIGVDHEFFESSLLPSIITYGFVGLDARPDGLVLKPSLPRSCPQMAITNLLYRNVCLDASVSNNTIEILLKDTPDYPIRLQLDGAWQRSDTEKTASAFSLNRKGRYTFTKKPSSDAVCPD